MVQDVELLQETGDHFLRCCFAANHKPESALIHKAWRGGNWERNAGKLSKSNQNDDSQIRAD